METDLPTTMLARVRRHMLTSLAGVVVAASGFGLAGALGAHGTGGPAVAIVGGLAFLAIPVVGFGSTFTNLRCPSCNGLVALQVSYHGSLFGRSASPRCRHCSKTIFDERIFRGFRRLGLTVFFGALTLGLAGALGSALVGR